MDLRKILARKRHQMESLEAQLGVLRDEVATLDRALEIATREEGNDTDAALGRAARDTGSIEGASTTDAKIDPPPAKLEPLHVISATEARQTGRLIGMIRDIVLDLSEPFSTVDVRNEIKRRDAALFDSTHYSSISGTMRRMAKQGGELVPVEKGGPGKEATYRRNDSQKPRLQADDNVIVEGERELVEAAR